MADGTTPVPPARERLLRAALETIDEVGVARATTRRIADRAGVNLQLIQYYFGGKEGLLDDAQRYIVDRFFEALAPAVTGAPSLAEAVRGGITDTWALAQTQPAMVQPDLLLQSVRAGQQDTALDRPRQTQVRIGALLGEVMDRTGERLKVPLDAFVLIMTAGLSGLILEYRVTGNADRVGAAVAHFADLMVLLVG